MSVYACTNKLSLFFTYYYMQCCLVPAIDVIELDSVQVLLDLDSTLDPRVFFLDLDPSLLGIGMGAGLLLRPNPT